ncbi:MAG: hypothetical protein R3C44_20340 [Chloroflexota bacterium]
MTTARILQFRYNCNHALRNFGAPSELARPPFYWVTMPEDQSHEIKAISAHVTYGWGTVPVTAYIRQDPGPRPC